ncbi:MAG: tetrahydrofolate dehydrogenase/cyclohydrolase catalytic domain-containing protein [Thermoplasmatota archaeon]
MHIVDGRAIAAGMEASVRRRVGDSRIHVVTLLMEGSRESALYARLKEQACRRVGITTETQVLPGDAGTQDFLRELDELNGDDDVHGVMVQLPLPGVDHRRLVEHIDPAKDVEGVHPCNLGATQLGDERLAPCTPRAVLRILEHENISLQGADVVVVNHSDIVGKPLADMLLNRDATVSVCHVYTGDLAAYTTEADVVVTGAGVRGLITGSMVKQGAAVVDVAIVSDEDGVHGDVEMTSMRGKAAMVTPVPGGVGPVTIACILENAVAAYKD